MDTILEQLRKTAEAHARVYQTALDAERAPKTRPMTRKEVLAWAAGVQAFGWVVRIHGDLRLPSCLAYNADVAGYTRAPIATLNDDGTGGEWEAFEVAGDE